MARRAIVAAFVVVVAACSADGPADDDGATTTAGPTATIGRATAAEVPLIEGQCGDVPRIVPGEAVDPATITLGDCQLPHGVEVAAVFEFPASPAIDFPGAAAVDGYATDQCLDRFDDYVGTAYLASRFDVTIVAPGAGGWQAGDRRIACLLYDADFAILTGPARGSGL
jgi:hypothetical protein